MNGSTSLPPANLNQRASDRELEHFLTESPIDRPAIFAFLQPLAKSLPGGTRVLDAGAGDAPYRRLFAHCDYVTSDWEQSEHPGAQSTNVLAPLDRLPLQDCTFDVVVNTQVLEHVADPLGVLTEFHRLLVPGGELWLTAPLVWELHEEPHDYFRFTSHGLRELLGRAGLATIEIQPLGGYFATLAQLVRHCGSITGLDRGPLSARLLTALLVRVAPALRRLDRLDTRRVLPLGYACRAKRP
jgi:SAM-dependent methyltransferase